MKILLFAGTTEGRALAERLAVLPVEVTVSVATEYGGEIFGPPPARCALRVGRLDAVGMETLLREGGYAMAIDATHPYAVEATGTIRLASAGAGIPRLRLLREEGSGDGCVRVASISEAVAHVARTEGNVLLATGSKDLDAFAAIPGFAERLYPRILPTPEALARCVELGYRKSHVVAMQGPFGRELNTAIMRHFGIRVLVTKDGGAEGGFREKLLAAADVGAEAVVVGRPAGDEGCSLEAIVEAVVQALEVRA